MASGKAASTNQSQPHGGVEQSSGNQCREEGIVGTPYVEPAIVGDLDAHHGFRILATHPPTNHSIFPAEPSFPIGLLAHREDQYLTILGPLKGVGMFHTKYKKTGLTIAQGFSRTSTALREIDEVIVDNKAGLTQEQIWLIRHGPCGYPLVEWVAQNCPEDPVAHDGYRLWVWTFLGIAIPKPDQPQPMQGI